MPLKDRLDKVPLPNAPEEPVTSTPYTINGIHRALHKFHGSCHVGFHGRSGYKGLNNQSSIHSGGHSGYFIQWADRMPHTNRVKGNNVLFSPQDEVPYSRGHMGGVWQSKESKKMLSVSVPLLNKVPSERETKRSRDNHMEINTVKRKADKDNSPKEMRIEKRVMPHEKVVIVLFKQGDKEIFFRIGTKLGEDHQQLLIALIREFEYVFTWGPVDMPDDAVRIKERRSHLPANDELHIRFSNRVHAGQKQDTGGSPEKY
ncbi:hypothetical protein LIER_06324 [Lithospermum erythrorhizon]|uniref:Uncharacterized protein n=1 Tax=Lithospermum erythrorhizon TaxID=34254 RepID=A0AAV3P8H2_LITER